MKTYKFVTGDTKGMTIHLRINGRGERVNIEPPVSYGLKDKAYYITSNSAIAEELKRHPAFNILFFLESEVDHTPVVEKKEKVVVDYLQDEDSAIYEETVTSKAKAVAYVQGMYDEAFQDMSSIDAMKKEAAQRWNVIFVNWK